MKYNLVMWSPFNDKNLFWVSDILLYWEYYCSQFGASNTMASFQTSYITPAVRHQVLMISISLDKMTICSCFGNNKWCFIFFCSNCHIKAKNSTPNTKIQTLPTSPIKIFFNFRQRGFWLNFAPGYRNVKEHYFIYHRLFHIHVCLFICTIITYFDKSLKTKARARFSCKTLLL